MIHSLSCSQVILQRLLFAVTWNGSNDPSNDSSPILWIANGQPIRHGQKSLVANHRLLAVARSYQNLDGTTSIRAPFPGTGPDE